MTHAKETQKAKKATSNIKLTELNSENFDQEVASINDAVIIYFTTLGPDEDVEKEYKYFMNLLMQFSGPVKTMVFRMSPAADDYQELKK